MDSADTPAEQVSVDLLVLFRRMLLIRRFETEAGSLYRSGQIPGFVHLAIGQEATAVGATAHLRDGDVITSTHRGHGHALARGLSAREMFAELMGRQDGVCGGYGGSMHIADPERGIFGANGIVGAGIPIAGGAALAAKLRGEGAVALAFLGDGALSTGAFHEAANLASLWDLPLVLFCENNRFSEFSHFDDQQPVPVESRAQGLGLNFIRVDGNDVVAVADCMQDVLARVRAGSGPYLVEALTLRVQGHYEGDPQRYREVDCNDVYEARDPLDVARQGLRDHGVGAEEIDAIGAAVDEEIRQAIEAAGRSPMPDPANLSLGAFSPRAAAPPVRFEPVADEDGTPTWKYFEAVREALRAEMAGDDRVLLAGIDLGRGGNVFGITRGLHERWPERVLDTPISETAIMGLAVGAAMAGLRPVVELMYFDFLGVCLDQLMNQAAKLRYMTGGRAQMGLTLRTQSGAGRSSGAQHSQSLEAILCHIPGLTVVMPSTPSDAYGLLRAAIQDPNPVIVVENRLLYGTSGPVCADDHLVPIGQAAFRTRGDDITIVSWGRMAILSIEAAEILAAEGISAEVIDLRTLAPLDMASVMESVAKTSRLMIVHEAHHDFGPGAEIAARMAADGLYLLDAPVRRLAPPHVPAPYSPVLEAAWLPGVDDVVRTARELVAF
jgi:2-oxoisovalerate dehydrogenase E1 component